MIRKDISFDFIITFLSDMCKLDKTTCRLIKVRLSPLR